MLHVLARRGFNTRLHAGGQALELLGGLGVTVDEVRQPLLPGATALARLAGRTARDWRAMRAHPPGLVISDGDQAAVLAARLCSVPSVAVGHDQVFRREVALAPLPRWALALARTNQSPMQAASRAIAVHFLPASSGDERVIIARPEPGFSGSANASEGGSGAVLCYFRDRNGEAIIQRLRVLGEQVVAYGDAAATTLGVERRVFDPKSFRAELVGCKAVVASAGSNLLAECVLLGKPVFALYRQGDSEQMLNALLAERAQVALAAPFATASQRVAMFLDRVARKDFARVDLAAALPPLSVALRTTLDSLER